MLEERAPHPGPRRHRSIRMRSGHALIPRNPYPINQMAKAQFFRDPVHTQIRFDAVDLDDDLPPDSDKHLSWVVRNIINCPEFQRLRHARQNGLTNYVFYGAEHSRFTHSLGAAHLARTMYDRITRNCEEPRDPHARLSTCVAALLHDIGHGPFSHALEEILSGMGVAFSHEKLTRRILTEDTEIKRVLESVSTSFPQELSEFIEPPILGTSKWQHRLVSSQLDSDRLDYLLRDALFTGIRGHSFDLERLLDMLTVHNTAIAVDRKALATVEAYLVSLDHMYRIVYHHHTVRGATRLMCSLVKRAFELFQGGNTTVFPSSSAGQQNIFASLLSSGDDIDIREYCNLGEYHAWYLFDSWQHSEDAILSDLAQRLMKRKIFKSVDLPDDFEEATQLRDRALDLVLAEFSFVHDRAEAEFYVTVDEPSRTSYKTYNWKAEHDDEAIWLVGGNAEPCPLQQERDSRIIQGLSEPRYFRRLMFPREIRHDLTS